MNIEIREAHHKSRWIMEERNVLNEGASWWVVRLHNEDWWIFCIRKLIRFTFKNREESSSSFCLYIISCDSIHIKGSRKDHSRWDRSSLLLSLFCWCLPRRRSSSTRPLGVKAKLNWEQEKKKEQKHHKTLCLCAERTYKEPPPPPHDDLIGSNLASRRRRVHANGLPVSTQLPAWCNTKSKRGDSRKRERRVKAVGNIHFCHDPAIQSRREFIRLFL